MPMSERAKIFVPFDALRGFREMLEEREREADGSYAGACEGTAGKPSGPDGFLTYAGGGNPEETTDEAGAWPPDALDADQADAWGGWDADGWAGDEEMGADAWEADGVGPVDWYGGDCELSGRSRRV